MKWFYISFAHPLLGFLGGAFVYAKDEVGAIQKTRELMINPAVDSDRDTQALICEMPEVDNYPKSFRNRLLTEADLRGIGFESIEELDGHTTLQKEYIN